MSTINLSPPIIISACPECGGRLQFGSDDPLEGIAFWCTRCNFGPIWFPHGEGPRKPVPAIIDADTYQASQGIQGAAAAIEDTLFKDTKSFNPALFVGDLEGS